jgi:hypothetical protein
VPPTNYIYELRQGDTVIATGHLTTETPLEIGRRLTINNRAGLNRSSDPTTDPHQQRLVVQLLPEAT